MRKPDLFIVGAPKCGTTSLWSWLRGHPQIFMSQMKEPNFFNTGDNLGLSTLAEYQDLFRTARPHHAVIGEASVWYLSSPVAVANILQYQPEARFIVLLRNPIEMAPAVHSGMLIAGRETIADFRAAWALQGERRQGRRLPALSSPYRCFLYGEVCSLGVQFERLLSMVPRRRVLPILLDEVRENPRREYLKVLQFLNLDDDGRDNFPVHNQARTLRWPLLTRATFLTLQVKERAGIKAGFNLSKQLFESNVVEEPRLPLHEQTRNMLREYFAGDIALLGRLIGKDLGIWNLPEDRMPETVANASEDGLLPTG